MVCGEADSVASAMRQLQELDPDLVVLDIALKGRSGLEIIQMIGQGKSTREISENLNLSIKTIGTYRERIKDKLGLKLAAELAQQAVQYVTKQNFGV